MQLINFEPFLQALTYPGLLLDATGATYTIVSTSPAFDEIVSDSIAMSGRSVLSLFVRDAELVRQSLALGVAMGAKQSISDIELDITKFLPRSAFGSWHIAHSPVVVDGHLEGILMTLQPMRQRNFRMCTDQLLDAAERRYDELFNNALMPMWIYDPETLCFLQVNDTACKRYGYTREEYAHMTLKDIRPAEDVAQMELAVAAVREKKQVVLPSYFRHRKKDGTIMYVKVQSSEVSFEGRSVRLAMATDITSELAAQSEMKDAYQRLHAASDMAHLGYWTNDLKGNIYWSDELYSMFGVEPGSFELTLDNIISCFHPEDAGSFNDNMKDLFDGRGVVEHERRIITPKGEIKWIFERLRVVRNSNGTPAFLEGVTLDVTRRKMDETAVRESNERFTLVMNATSEAIIDWDIANDSVVWGEGFRDLFGYDLSVYDNNLWSRNIHEDDKERVMRTLDEAISDPGRQRYYVEFRFHKSNGSIAYVQHRAIFLRDANGAALRAIGAMADVTETMKRIREIEQQNEVLREIAWVQSHVVRAPLASLMGMVDLLRNADEYDLDRGELVDNISALADKLDDVIRSIVKKSEQLKL